MIVQVNKPFGAFALNQIIDTKKYELNDDSVTQMLVSNVVSLVVDYVEKIDLVNDNLIYKGKAYHGALSSEAVWTITVINTSGTITSKNTHHNQIWDNRSSL